jgi:dihydrofolate reductase
MSKVFLTMAMSLDGFITGPHDDAQNPAGANGMRLMDWLDGVDKDGNTSDDYRPSDPNNQIVFDEAMSSGAVITGRRTGDFAGYWGGDHHNGVPIFVPTPTTYREPLRAGPLHHRRHRGVRAAGQSSSR